ncbi:rhodanese-like domain-containing protein [Sphaerisporangium perillae]|uniref:rhodanese-like domain-containing protein n=1 Tax=Sphaerisporangium perillae TaxID=2935860 RepID=UPI00200E32E0|nr:rhodanese-like domain-containing protein [Sphaerisporangium perillae]
MNRVTREDLLALLQTRAVQLVEALPIDAYAAEHIPGARNLPGHLSADVVAQMAPDRAATVVVYCSGPCCNRSKIAAAAFVQLGYADVRVYAGGKQDWAEAGLTFDADRMPPPAAVSVSGAGRPA